MQKADSDCVLLLPEGCMIVLAPSNTLSRITKLKRKIGRQLGCICESVSYTGRTERYFISNATNKQQPETAEGKCKCEEYCRNFRGKIWKLNA